MKKFINLLKDAGLLREIDAPLDCELEIAHVAYVEAKKPRPQALLFTRPVRAGRELSTPVLANLFASEAVLNMVLKNTADGIAARIEGLLRTHIPADLRGKMQLANRLLALRNITPKRKLRAAAKGAPCKERRYELAELPILRTWEQDAGDFITMGQVYTRSLDGAQNNLGMYRLQVIDGGAGASAEAGGAGGTGGTADKPALIAHFQLHKDANNFYQEYARAGQKMPVAIAIGAHPLHILCAQAPLPKGIFELLLAGFIAGKGAELVQCESNDLFVPAGADFVIEGFIDPAAPLALEGPFGDHTGFYTPQGLFPRIEISAITGRREAVYNATVVGKPPLEDRWMGYATERIFAPLLRQSVPAVIDYHLPEAGAFHNLCVVKIRADYPGAAQAVAHAFWGLGQMAFCKNIIAVGADAPALKDYPALAEYVLQNLHPQQIFTASGICDELDHSSAQIGLGGKLLIDASGAVAARSMTLREGVTGATGGAALTTPDDPENPTRPEDLTGGKNCANSAALTPPTAPQNRGRPESPAVPASERFTAEPVDILRLKELSDADDIDVFYPASAMPIVCLHLKNKRHSIDGYFAALREHIRGVVVLFNDAQSHLPYMLLWRALANFDAARDLRIAPGGVLIDACSKGAEDGYQTPWPQEVKCSAAVIKRLIEAKILESDFVLFKKFEILTDSEINQIKENDNGNF